jgi:DNA-directed RNA polymerase sigma subunit (sigma70/sigma32)
LTVAASAPSARVSLDAPIADATTLESMIADRTAPDPAAETIAHEETRIVSEAIRRLPVAQRLVITRHFGFDGDAVPLSRIARELRACRRNGRRRSSGLRFTASPTSSSGCSAAPPSRLAELAAEPRGS